jgi:ATP-dependent protease ClpP protease subunit
MHAIYYNGPVNAGGMRNTQQLLADAVAKRLDDIVLVLSSNGGDVASGMGLYHFIRGLPVPVRLHAAGVCSSIAATILLASDTRTGADPTQFVLHAATYREGPNQGQRASNTAVVTAPYRDRLGWDEARIDACFTDAETALSVRQACDWGMVQAIAELRLAPGDTTAIVSIPR